MVRPALKADELSRAIACGGSQSCNSIRTPIAMCTAVGLYSVATGFLRGLGKNCRPTLGRVGLAAGPSTE
jgi:hypothetical protein